MTNFSESISNTLAATDNAYKFANLAQEQNQKTFEMFGQVSTVFSEINKVTSTLSKFKILPKQQLFADTVKISNSIAVRLSEDNKATIGALSDMLKANSNLQATAADTAKAVTKSFSNTSPSTAFITQINGLKEAFSLIAPSAEFALSLKEASKVIVGFQNANLSKFTETFSQTVALSREFASASTAFSSLVGSIKVPAVGFKKDDWFDPKYTNQLGVEILPHVDRLIESSDVFLENLNDNDLELVVSELTKTGQEKVLDALTIFIIFTWGIAINGPLLHMIKSNFEFLLELGAVYEHYAPGTPKLLDHALILNAILATLNKNRKNEK